jgi:hypothetical protein
VVGYQKLGRLCDFIFALMREAFKAFVLDVDEK